MNLENAVVWAPEAASGPIAKAVQMLVEEVEKRTQIRWPVEVERIPNSGRPITVGTPSGLATAGRIDDIPPKPADGRPEGYFLCAESYGVDVVGVDARGILYGIGGLLRNLQMGRQRVSIEDGFEAESAPAYPLRGHQLGYRPKTNSYDAWSVPMWEQYIRDLAVFGANAVELIPPRSDDDADSPHFPLPPMRMMVEMSRLLDEYGLDVWVWYPAMDSNYDDPAGVESAVREWSEVLSQLPRVDNVFVPGGDPGHTEPKVLMRLLERQAESIRRLHRNAGVWVSPQGFTQAWMDQFLTILREDQPDWLAGVVYGPQVRIPLARFRDLVPARYPIRDYPDITHCRQCQYPPLDWDVAWALTEGREGINPRPLDEARIIRATQRHTIGFITYSEGCNDDVNKAIWSALGWDPEEDVGEVLREYSRYFIGDKVADSFALGLLGLERNWRGSAMLNSGIPVTLSYFQEMERDATPQMRLNWRFQQALYRAYYDAYVRVRSNCETLQDGLAISILERAAQTGSLAAIDRAESELDRCNKLRVGEHLRARVFELAEALYQSIRMQLSVERYQAIAVDRGANLDTIDVTLNNRPWLLERFAAIRQMESEAERLAAIDEIVHWTDPGPGGFHDAPGIPGMAPHLVGGLSVEADPGRHESPRVGFASAGGRLAWACHAETLYDTPLTMRYEGLNPETPYRLRVVYAGDSPTKKMRLTAGEGTEIHGFIPKPRPIQPLEFDIPPEVTRGGVLELRWHAEPGQGGNGRACQVSEVWLFPANPRQ